MKKNKHHIKSPAITLIALVALIGITLFVGGCAGLGQPVNVIKKASEPDKETAVKKETDKKKKGKVLWVQQPEDDSIVSAAKARKEMNYLMNFDNISIPDFIETMMAGVFKLNYMLSDEVKATPGRFTIKMTEDLKSKKAFKLFEKILAMHNIVVERNQNTYIFKSDKTGKSVVTLKGPVVYGRQVPASFSASDSDEITFLIPFYNITPGTLKPLLEAQLPSRAIVYPIEELSVLLINANYEDIKHTLSFIDLLDRVQFKYKSILMISPEYWDVDEFQEKVMDLLSAEGVRFETNEMSRGLMFIPIEKLNSLIVISPFKEWVERVLYWLEKLDIPKAAGESQKVFSYKLKNVEVDSISDVLQSYLNPDENMNSGSSRYNRGRNTNRSQSNRNKGKNSKGVKDSKNKSSSSRNRSNRMGGMGGEPIEGEKATVIPIYETNSLIMIATPVEYKKIIDIVKRIDVPRSQVFVEVIIGEVTLDKSTQLGLEFWMNRYLYGNRFGTMGGLGVYKGADEQGNALLTSGSNFFADGTIKNTQFELLINALVEHSKINIISTPKLTVVENVEAEISVGSEVPVISSESAMSLGAGTGAYPFRSVQYINTGIILKVRPSILSDNKIALEIEQEISEALTNKTSDISSPEITKRTIKTTLIVNEGEIAFLGGMFQKKLTNTASGIPVLSKIPLLGQLFKSSDKQIKKTELVVFINSKTIKKRNDMKDIVDEVKRMFSDKLYIEEKN
ncbi:MAG: type II secretion system secretin GspD [bacterium]|nr:type II secretion system secretin GspD [bacterium]